MDQRIAVFVMVAFAVAVPPSKASAAILSIIIPGPVHSQTLSDITGDWDQCGVMIPGIIWKNQTNNEATVRNLAHGVKNNSSNTSVVLNYGFPASYPMVANTFNNDARVDTNRLITFVGDAGVTNATFKDSFCNFYVSSVEDPEQTPASPSSTTVSLGQVRVNFPGTNLVYEGFVSTSGVTYPDNYNFFRSCAGYPGAYAFKRSILSQLVSEHFNHPCIVGLVPVEALCVIYCFGNLPPIISHSASEKNG